jgi:hypothetical protein
MAAWTDDRKQLVIKLYNEGDPTPENSMELVKEIAEKLGESPNGVRMVLSNAGVYQKKSAEATTSASKSTVEGKEPAKRVSKDSAIGELKALIESKGLEVDEDILSKLTGKAAAYFTKILT